MNEKRIVDVKELSDLRINQLIEARGLFSRRSETGISYRIVYLTVLSVDEYTGSCIFVDHEGEKWTSLDIFNIIEGDSASWYKFLN
ncbi:hypothetical protein GCM10008014_09030 [Paenibacillus silvae]|uniref:Uncharacterized protein n=1 Tax=Paenibacillus silvae TaxID=1325358 RepID=A0ABQ1Z1M9_9BACL|nr:hypothetical protein GCM10008014_09030 [Paenibacillus silvae]